MADTKREIERKYEGPAADGGTEMPDLSGVPGVARVVDKGVAELDATYYDTSDQRLATASSPCAAAPAATTPAGT